MAHFSVPEANAWLEPTKLNLSAVEPDLEAQVTTQVYSRLLGTFDTSTWLNEATTPKIVRTTLAMYYVSWLYDRAYSDDEEANAYAALLRRYADLNIEGLVGGTIELEELPGANVGVSSPTFFPTDASSANEPTELFPSDGGPAFTMGTVF